MIEQEPTKRINVLRRYANPCDGLIACVKSCSLCSGFDYSGKENTLSSGYRLIVHIEHCSRQVEN